MKNYLNLTAALFISAGLCFAMTGCKSTEQKSPETEKKEEKKKAELKNINEQEKEKVRKIAEEYIENILIGMKDQNYKLFSENLTDELRQDINKDKFALMVEKFKKEKGDYVSKKYLGELGKGFFKVFLWKAQFVKEDQKNKKTGKKDEIKDETLVRLILGNVDNKYLVFGFSFQ